ncbi:uncharacterized protein LOC120645553 [Panicum virgatum]|uniref:uncharacterized protein LOC120645553 n=1 Tax=Panicum virgatum TaxID=38727 RepID=UPI0019D5DCFD|nr:uncharacterized protein LOC120645553 [Panicum virgatum]
MNPKKCAFGVIAGKFLGFMVHERGIKLGDKSKNAIMPMTPPGNKKELQSLISKLNYIRRFILNLSSKIEPFMPLMKIKSTSDFTWGQDQQKAFDELKRYLSSPPVLVPPQLDQPFTVYLLADERFGAVQLAPADPLHPIIKPRPFRGWGMDMIGQINPPTSKGHKWILAATDYFTKWVETVPMKNVTAKDVVNFIKEHIIYRFGIPQTIATDQGTVFTAEEFKKFAKEMGITLIQSSPYYLRAG